MTLLHSHSAASVEAEANLAANIAALRESQQESALEFLDPNPALEWVYGRDGSLTALDEEKQWLAGCSLPRRAAETIYDKADVKGAVGCFLDPPHAAAINAVITKLRPEQALITVAPDSARFTVMLHCTDFSQAIRARRLWFAAGALWEVNLRDLFKSQPGLATPSNFIRSPDAENEALQEQIASAQEIIQKTIASRAAAAEVLRVDATIEVSSATRVCVIAPSRFRLWNDLGATLESATSAIEGFEFKSFDTDNPANSAPLALLTALRGCGMLLTANTARTDLPGVVPDHLPWITWASGARLPSSAVAGIDDHLIVIDDQKRRAAIQAGWPEQRTHVGGWMALDAPMTEPGRSLALIDDTAALDTPDDLLEYSSHSILWGSIREELSKNPFAANAASAFLNERMRRHNVSDEAFPRQRFLDTLIHRARSQAMARLLLANSISLDLYGAGWSDLEEFAPHAMGPITSREQMHKACASARALVVPFASGSSHPATAVGRPIVRGDVSSAQAFLSAARSPSPARASAPPLVDALRQVLKALLVR